MMTTATLHVRSEISTIFACKRIPCITAHDCQNRFDTDINIETGGVLYTTENDDSQRRECTAGEIKEPQTLTVGLHAVGRVMYWLYSCV